MDNKNTIDVLLFAEVQIDFFPSVIKWITHSEEGIQQLFINSTVMPGVHYSTDIDFLICNYFMSKIALGRVIDLTHPYIVAFMNKHQVDENDEDAKEYIALINRSIKISSIRYLSNWCNLTISPN